MRRTGGAKCGAARTCRQLHGVTRVEENPYGCRVCARSRAEVRDGAKYKNGEGGIRTRETGVNPSDGLANRWFQPLTHLSGTVNIQGTLIQHSCIPSSTYHIALLNEKRNCGVACGSCQAPWHVAVIILP